MKKENSFDMVCRFSIVIVNDIVLVSVSLIPKAQYLLKE